MQKISADGVRLIKLKTGFKSHQFDIMRCEYIRKYHPELSLRVDFNQGLEAEEGVSRTLDLATFEPDFIEQPVRAHDYETMAEINRQCPVLLQRRNEVTARLNKSVKSKLSNSFYNDDLMAIGLNVATAYDLPDICHKCLDPHCDGGCAPSQQQIDNVRHVKQVLATVSSVPTA